MCLSFWDFGRKVSGLSLNGSQEFSKLQFMCPQISFVGKKFFHQYRILSQNFLPLLHKSARRISKLHLACPGEKFEENYCLLLKTKNFIWFFLCFSPQNLSENLVNLHSKCPEDLSHGKMLFETPQNCLSFLQLEANRFWIFGKTFSIKMSKLLFMCPDKRIVEKSLFISSKIWEIYSAISGKKRDLHSVLSKIALSVWRESLTEVPSDFFQFSAGSPNWTLALRKKNSSKKTFHEKNKYFYRFRTLTELHLHVQRKVLFRNTVLDFFHQGMTLSQKFLNLLEFLWIFHSKPPSTSAQELL